MPKAFEDVERQAQALPAEERAKLAEVLLESLRSPLSEIEAAWAEEIESRVGAFDRGELGVHEAEEVFADARRRIR